MFKALMNWLRRDLDWREDFTREHGLRMKRRVAGVWEYREPTEAEARDAQWWQAIK